MRKRLLILKLIAALLAACATPIASPQATQPAALPPTAIAPTQPPSPTPTKIGPTATPDKATSDAPLGSSVLLASWNRRSALHELRPFDPRQGLPVANYAPIELGRNYVYAFSPNGARLAVVAYPSDMSQRNGLLHLIDVQAWRDVTTTIRFDGWVSAMAFNPDGTRLAAAYFDEAADPDAVALVMIDLAAQSVAARVSPAKLPRLVEFTPDGASLIVYGGPLEQGVGAKPFAQAALFSAADLSVVWDSVLPDILDGQERLAEGYESGAWVTWRPAIALSPDRSALHIVHADDDVLTTVNFAARSVTSVEIGPAQSWLDRLMGLGAGVAYAKSLDDGTWKRAALSPDGTRLYIIGMTGVSSKDSRGQWQFSETPFGLKVVDTASGVEIATFDTPATEIDVSPDGARLYLRSYDSLGVPWTDVVTAAGLDVAAHLGGRYAIPTQQMDGQSILLSSDSHTGETALALMDARSLDALHVWNLPTYAVWVSPSWNPNRW